MKHLIFTLFIFLCVFPLFATNHHVRDGSTGNNDGTDWTNAWEDMGDITWGSGGIERGDTLYVADGSYTSDTFNLAVSGSTYVYIKKATSSSHGTETGWNNSYGDGQAAFDAEISFSTSYWDWDGISGSGKTGSSYGFKTGPHVNCSQNTKTLSMGAVSYISIKHTEIAGCGSGYGYYQRGLYSAAGATYCTIANNYFHDHTNFLLVRNIQSWIVEHNYFKTCWESGGIYGEAISCAGDSNNTVRYNIFEDCDGTSIIHQAGAGGSTTGWEFYGNVVFDATGLSDQAFSATNEFNNGKIYNNTFVNVTKGGVDEANGSGTLVYNNLYYNCTGTGFSCTHDYNWFYNSGSQSETHIQNGSGDPFDDYSGDDYHPSAATDNGKDDLGSPYNEDMDENIRGADNIWDRGAYEYDGNGHYSKFFMILTQIQMMPIFWALFSIWAYAAIKAINRIL